MADELTFVFADLAGYTALTEAHGDDDAAQIATRFHELARACLPAGTRLVKAIGDAVMLAASSERGGLEARPSRSRGWCSYSHPFPHCVSACTPGRRSSETAIPCTS